MSTNKRSKNADGQPSKRQKAEAEPNWVVVSLDPDETIEDLGEYLQKYPHFMFLDPETKRELRTWKDRERLNTLLTSRPQTATNAELFITRNLTRELGPEYCKYLNGSLNLRHASEELRNDREIVLAAVSQYAYALEYASEELRNDREIVLAAVSQYAYALEYASEELRNNREIVLAAVSQNGRALEYASAELRNDREIVLAAVSQYGYALKYASEELRNNHEIVLAAVSQDGYALKYASDELRNDHEFMLAVVSNEAEIFEVLECVPELYVLEDTVIQKILEKHDYKQEVICRLLALPCTHNALSKMISAQRSQKQ